VKSEPASWARDLRTLFLWLREGRLRPYVSARYPLERGAQSLSALLDRQVSGKLIIVP
jgi:NADPH2:quinone reductase